jgi:hypothetical protein
MLNSPAQTLRRNDRADLDHVAQQTVRYCRDTYEVVTADGNKRQFFERNLMMGDRADVIFSGPDDRHVSQQGVLKV